MCSGRCLEAVESTHEEEETVVLEILTWLESAETRLVYEDPPFLLYRSRRVPRFEGSRVRGARNLGHHHRAIFSRGDFPLKLAPRIWMWD